MNKSINSKFRQNIIIISIIITTIFLIINISLYIINNNYLVNKVEEENAQFLQITTHIMNENDISVGLEYVEHYTHIHEVNIEVLNESDEMLFSSKVSHKYTSRYTIDTLKGTFTIFIDNTDSVTVNRVEMNTIYVNVSLVIIYITALLILIKVNKQNSDQINKDILNILNLMESEKTEWTELNYIEFHKIYHAISLYLENIDILTEQKEMNMKGLAHDIKTPLTLVYSYFEKVQQNKDVSDKDRKIAFESSKRINELLNDLIENKENASNRNINLSEILLQTLIEHESIFDNKNIQIIHTIENDVFVNWNQKDLSRVLDNMISNAYYYSINHSDFEVTLLKEDQIYLTFRSQPNNLEEIDIEKIFKKGYRDPNSKEFNQYGKGYGLYLCRILLKSINGKISAKKTQRNVEFTIIL